MNVGTSEREAERRLSHIVREFLVEMRRPVACSRRAVLLTSRPRAADGVAHSVLIIVGEPIFRSVVSLVETRAITDDGVRVLRQTAFDRPWFDIAIDITDDRIVFRVGKIYDVREESA